MRLPSVRLSEVSTRIGSGITPRGGSAVYKASGRPFVRSQNIGWGDLRLDELAHISDATHMTFPASEICSGDVLLNITGASIGRSAVATPDLDGGNVNQHVCEIRLKQAIMDPCYVNAILNSSMGQDQIAAFQAGGNRQGLNFQQVGSIRVPVIDLAQQRAIGRARQVCDDGIATLERLIAKKQAIKQGMMQQLLTGKTRLPGFTGQMQPHRLSDVAVKIQDGTHFSPQLGGSDFRYVTSRNIGLGSMRLDAVETISAAEHRQIFSRCDTKFGDLLITKDGANTGNAALNPFHDEISLLSSVAFVRCVPRRASEFYILQYFLSYQGQQQIKDAMAGNAITRLTLAKIRDLVVPMPSVEEQRAIARLLGDLDTGIVAVQKRLAKARAIKQGMMQQLLTGRTRLPVAESGG